MGSAKSVRGNDHPQVAQITQISLKKGPTSTVSTEVSVESAKPVDDVFTRFYSLALRRVRSDAGFPESVSPDVLSHLNDHLRCAA